MIGRDICQVAESYFCLPTKGCYFYFFLFGTQADRLLRLQQAAEFYLMQIVEIHTFVGIVSFNSKGEIRAQLRQINSDDDRKLLVSHLPSTVSAEAQTSVCSGLKKGFEVQLGTQCPNHHHFPFLHFIAKVPSDMGQSVTVWS